MSYGHPLRKFPRVPSENTVLVKKMGQSEVEGFTKTKTVGLGGCMFLSDESFGIGSYFEIFISAGSHVVKAKGKVVYEIPDESGVLNVGAEFVDIDDEDRKLLETLWLK